MTAAELIELRKRFNWSQEEAARKLGCSAGAIFSWEKGINEIPDSVAFAAAAVMYDPP